MNDPWGPDEEIARAFVAARRGGVALPEYPGAMPDTLDQGYAVQAQAIRLFGGAIGGWKVGRVPAPLVDRFGIDRLAGPIFSHAIVDATDDAPEMPIFAGGFGAVEAEYLLRLGDLPEGFDRTWTNEMVACFVDAVHVGIEIASSPFPGINTHGPAVTVSDFGNNNGLVIGGAVPRGADFLDWPVELRIDGAVAGAATARAMLDGPFGAVRFLFELAAQRDLPLARGQWISTGAVTGVHQAGAGAEVEAKFGKEMRARCRIGIGQIA